MRIPLLCALSAALLVASNASSAGAFSKAGTMAAQAAASPAPAAAPAREVLFGPEELAQVVAPIALYPDPLLAQVLMGATYPGDVADAAKWSKAHPDEKGETAVTKVADQPWDPSVQALVAFPQVLDMLGQDPAWVQKLGDAFLAQSNDVMDAVQKLRRQAQDAGNLSSNEQQKVSTLPALDGTPTGADGETVIVIEPSEPDVIYVPAYNPTTVYGSWAYPYYPPMYYPPPAYYYPGGAFAAGIFWGVAISGGCCWGNMNWGGGDIDIDIDRYNEFNRNNQINGGDRNRGERGDRGSRGEGGREKWNHNAANRDGVPYRDQANRERNGRQMDGASNRQGFRGESPQRSQQRDQARNTMSDRGIKPATSNVDARNQARTAQQQRGQYGGQGMSNSGARNSARDLDRMNTQPHNNAFRDASRPSSSNLSQQRGNYSRNSASRPSSSRPASRPVSRPSRPPMRSGGGGRRR
ncbi:DUF3300 domain-containing protein [Arenimonas daejeonensis]|uniref:DUF3300 domain-containing protein n=1 Tax=Arenimonas daejeonensis TaxID=370777 RepID=UPI0011BE3F18|nr:DUF3300 domain-containing protein [Arenimonas daejeonensis]